MNTHPPIKRALTVNEFCNAYGLGRTKTYSLIADGRLPVVHVGRRTLIPVEGADRWFASLTDAA